MRAPQTKDIARAALFTALAVALSPLSIPVGATRVSPTQAMINVLSGVILGPWYAVLVAFATSLIRNLLGTGTINAFAGSMIGAFLAGVLWRATRNIYASALGEIVGTGILATLVTVYIVAPNILHKKLALSVIGLAFLASTVAGAIVAVIILRALQAAGVVHRRSAAAPDEQLAVAPEE